MKLDLVFKVAPAGKEIHRYHSYPLYAAMSHLLGQEFHDSDDFGIFPITGQRSQSSLIIVKESALRLRIPVEKLEFFIKLSCKTLNINGSKINLGVILGAYPLKPCPSLISDIVTVRHKSDKKTYAKLTPESMLGSISHQCEKMGVRGKISILKRNGKTVPQMIPIKSGFIVGYAVRVDELNDEDSVKLQENGLGGRRKFACGLFRPVK